MAKRLNNEQRLWLGGLAASACAVLLLNTPLAKYLPPCPLNALFGLYCPGCGSGRLLRALVHGHFFEALRANPLMFVLLPPVLLMLAWHFCRAMFGWPKRTPRLPRYTGWVLLCLCVGFGILRNIAHYPFTLLAPFG